MADSPVACKIKHKRHTILMYSFIFIVCQLFYGKQYSHRKYFVSDCQVCLEKMLEISMNLYEKISCKKIHAHQKCSKEKQQNGYHRNLRQNLKVFCGLTDEFTSDYLRLP